MVNCMTIDVRGHCILKCQTYEMNAVHPTKTIFHENAHPMNHATFSRAWEAMDEVQQWLLSMRIDAPLSLFEHFYLQTSQEVFEVSTLLCIRPFRGFQDLLPRGV